MSRPRIFQFLTVLLAMAVAPPCHATNLMPALGWDAAKQGRFPVSLALDLSGNVWVGTEGNGVWKYDPARKDWTQYTTNDGLGDNCVYALAVDRQNRVWAGHLNHGVSVFNGDKWRNYGITDGPLGDRVFSIAVSPKDGNVWIATDMGLARYSEERQDWDYYTRAGGLPSDQIRTVDFNDSSVIAITWENNAFETTPADGFTKWLSISDQISTLPPGESLLPKTPKPENSVLLRAALRSPGEPPLYAVYGQAAGGLMTTDDAPPFKATASPATKINPPLPAPAPPPMLGDFRPLAARLGKLTGQIATGEAFFLADDWRTEGDWVGRYGSGYAKLCGMSQGGDQDYPLEPGFAVSIQAAPGHSSQVSSFHEDDTSADLRSLYDPTLGHRRDAGTRDSATDGTGLWVRVKVPEGVHCLSFYFVNNDAHTHAQGANRDYTLDIVSDDPDDKKIAASPPLASTRVTDFWGGVYKQFLIRGPATYVARIGCSQTCFERLTTVRSGPSTYVGHNQSSVTQLQALFLDPIEPAENQAQLPGFDAAPYSPPNEPDNYQPAPLADAAINLWSQLDDGLSLRGAVALQMPFRIWCYRAAISAQAPSEILERWRWQFSIWTPDDRTKFDAAMKAAHDALK